MNDWMPIVAAILGTLVALRVLPAGLLEWLGLGQTGSRPATPLSVPTLPVAPPPAEPLSPNQLINRPGVQLLLRTLAIIAASTPNRLDDLAVLWARRMAGEYGGEAASPDPKESVHSAGGL